MDGMRPDFIMSNFIIYLKVENEGPAAMFTCN